jgi:YidC/Oxa1 family membrane protein insertase
MTELLSPIVGALRYVLEFFNTYVNSLGWSIILLTLTVRVVLLPLTLKQTRAMKDMQRLQPLLKEIQAKYKNDKEKLAEAQMALYKEHKVNPLGGCLPLILQMPIFFALFTLLRDKMFVGHGFGPLADLSIGATAAIKLGWLTALPYFLLVVLIVGTQFISQKQTTTDPSQAKMMAFMPVIIGVISISLPVGVLLYWTVFNAAMILQQWIDNKYLDKHPGPVVAPAKQVEPVADKPKQKPKGKRGKKNR